MAPGKSTLVSKTAGGDVIMTPKTPQDWVLYILIQYYLLLVWIYNKIRRAAGFKNEDDELEDFLNTPASTFESAAPADPHYDTFYAIDDKVFVKSALQKQKSLSKKPT